MNSRETLFKGIIEHNFKDGDIATVMEIDISFGNSHPVHTSSHISLS